MEEPAPENLQLELQTFSLLLLSHLTSAFGLHAAPFHQQALAINLHAVGVAGLHALAPH